MNTPELRRVAEELLGLAERLQAQEYAVDRAICIKAAGLLTAASRSLAPEPYAEVRQNSGDHNMTERRSFWVVERFENGRSVGYWDGGSSRHFVTDIDKAIQFCRKMDAYFVVRLWHWKDIEICEHIYLAPEPILKGEVGEMVRRLRNRTEMVNYGHGDVRDIPDEDCAQAADLIESLAARLAEAVTETVAWRECAKYDPLMSGPVFKTWDRSALDRCRKQYIDAARASQSGKGETDYDKVMGQEGIREP